MRRTAIIAAFALFLTVPLWAQHGGGGHGGGGHGGGFAGHSGFSGGHSGGGFVSHAGSGSVHTFSGAHSFSGGRAGPQISRRFSSSARPGFSRGPFLHNGFGNGRFRNRGFRNTCRGFPCRGFYGYGFGYPWGYSGYYDPYWWDSGYDDSSYDQDYQNDLATADQMNAENLEEQRMLQQEEADGDQDAYARPAARSLQQLQQQEDKPGAPIMPATVLVFRDQHKQEVQNYAIVGQNLWNFSPQHTQRIPLADLDLAATAKANDDNGVTFRIPNVNEAQ